MISGSRKRLTLNLGLRWEYFGPISEQNNLLANLGPDGQLHMVGTGGVNGAYARDLNNFGPRFGFAWNPMSRTIIRGGYGIYYDYIPQDLMIANFTNDAGLVTPPLGPKPVISLANNYNQAAFSSPAPGVPVFTVPPSPYPLRSFFFTPHNFVTPYSQNWNFNVQQEFVKNVALQLGYVGSKGTKLDRLLDANQPNAAGNATEPEGMASWTNSPRSVLDLQCAASHAARPGIARFFRIRRLYFFEISRRRFRRHRLQFFDGCFAAEFL